MRVDVHQHIWTEPLLDALADRAALPFVVREDGLTLLHCAGERPFIIDTDAEAPGRRAMLVHDDGLDLAAIAPSSPIGVEALPRAQATELIDAHLAGVAAMPEEFVAWGPVALDGLDPADVDRLAALGCVGITLPAPAIANWDALRACSELLARAAERQMPVFVHPGSVGRRALGLEEPLWWSALTDYVAQMQAAWLTFTTLGRAAHPDLVILFAMLAGGAPLLSERLTARGGPMVDLRDPWMFYDTSSYGRVAIDAMARRVGRAQLVYGSDRPVVEPTLTGLELPLAENGARLLFDRLRAWA